MAQFRILTDPQPAPGEESVLVSVDWFNEMMQVQARDARDVLRFIMIETWAQNLRYGWVGSGVPYTEWLNGALLKLWAALDIDVDEV